MKKLLLPVITLATIFASCEKDEITIIEQGDYPVKEYYLERDPRVNVWGAGMDLIHCECALTETALDYSYMEETDDFTYDINFYVVKAYYYTESGDLANEGCPALILAPDVEACKVGEGVAFFDSLTIITEDMLSGLVSDPVIDYESFKDETTGFYEREALFSALEDCVIGRSFRSNVLVVPEGKTEQEVQAVYLIKTAEGGYAKFMVKQFKGDKPYEKQTLMRWQVISE